VAVKSVVEAARAWKYWRATSNVTFVPTFVANKSLTFTLSSSDIAQA